MPKERAVVYVVDLRDRNVAGDLEPLLSFLPEASRKKVMRKRQADDRMRTAVGEGLLLQMVNHYFPDTDVKLTQNAYGKPLLAEPAHHFHFNLSHSGKWVALAVANASIGVDVEERRPQDAKDFEDYFSARERRMLYDSDDWLFTFYRIWTYREAFCKEEGRGLSLFDTEEVAIDYKRDRVIYAGERLSFWTADLADHTLTICAKETLLPPMIYTVDRLFPVWQTTKRG